MPVKLIVANDITPVVRGTMIIGSEANDYDKFALECLDYIRGGYLVEVAIMQAYPHIETNKERIKIWIYLRKGSKWRDAYSEAIHDRAHIMAEQHVGLINEIENAQDKLGLSKIELKEKFLMVHMKSNIREFAMMGKEELSLAQSELVEDVMQIRAQRFAAFKEAQLKLQQEQALDSQSVTKTIAEVIDYGSK